MSATFPPLWSKVPLPMIFDAGLPDPVFRTMCKLLAASYPFRYERSPNWTIMEMASVAEVSERTMWGHLSAMRESVHCRVESPRRGHYVFHWLFACSDDAVSANPCTGPLVVDPSTNLTNHHSPNTHQQQQSSSSGGVQGGSALSAKVCTLPGEILQDLAEIGWAGSLKVVEAAWADNPDRVRAWLEYWLDPPGNGRVQNPAGLFRRSLESGAMPVVIRDKAGSKYQPCRGCYQVTPVEYLCPDCSRCEACCECEVSDE